MKTTSTTTYHLADDDEAFIVRHTTRRIDGARIVSLMLSRPEGSVRLEFAGAHLPVLRGLVEALVDVAVQTGLDATLPAPPPLPEDEPEPPYGAEPPHSYRTARFGEILDAAGSGR